MGRLIAVVGASGVGKTTLVAALRRHAPFAAGLEQHRERPFQALMAADLRRYALANQIDYLLYRAEQEQVIRAGSSPGLVDGGLDLDFYGFTRLFHRKGYLTDAEYELCARLYHMLRQLLGPPDLILYLTAPPAVVVERHARRGRALEIAQRDDLALMDALIADWLERAPGAPVITLDASTDDYLAPERLRRLLDAVEQQIAPASHSASP